MTVTLPACRSREARSRSRCDHAVGVHDVASSPSLPCVEGGASPGRSSIPGGFVAPVRVWLNCEPRWRERLPEIEVPTLVVHGRRDRFFPVANGEAIAREIPGAALLVLEEAATAIPDAAAPEVAQAMLALG